MHVVDVTYVIETTQVIDMWIHSASVAYMYNGHVLVTHSYSYDMITSS